MNPTWMLTMLVALSAAFAWSANRRWQLLKVGGPENRLDFLAERVKAVWRYAFRQEKMDYYQPAGIAHKLIFVGFITLLFRTIVLVGLSLFGLCAGTLYLKKFASDVAPFEATAVQLIGGAALSIVLMALLETPHARWTPDLIAAMGWNVVAMSIFGMAIYNLMMDRYGAAKAASGFFVVPGASALMAWLLIDEHLRPIVLIGLACATLGVILVWWKPRKV